MSNSKDPSRKQDAPQRPGAPRPPVSPWQNIFWIIMLILIPVAGFMFFSGDEDVETLTQSEFEKQLLSGTVSEVVIKEPESGSICQIDGIYVANTSDTLPGAEQMETRFTTKVIFTEHIDTLIRQHCKDYTAKSVGSPISNLFYMLLPTLLIIAFFYFIFVRQMRGNSGVMNFGKSRARRMDPNTTKPITLADVAGCDEAKDDMQELVDYLKNPGRFSRLGGTIPRGVLLVGPPGTGKTLLAKAIAGEAKVPFFSISGSDFVEMFVGVGASRVRDMFEEGHQNAPCLIFIDEIDAVGRSRFSGIGGGHDEREQTLNALLVEMDGFAANQGVIVLAATNRPDVLDPALLRPGRFDRQITVDLPDLRGRVAILKIHAAKTRLAEDVDLRIIARGTPGFSGADLANLINEAALLATRRNLEAVGMAELEESRDKVRWGKERRSMKLDEKERRLTAFHEAGHALTGMLCPNSMPLHKITIIPRGAALGATMSLPEKDEVSKSRTELLDMLAMMFGGRVAEEIIFNEISTGAAMDIKQATDIAKKMVCQWGMSESLGTVNYAGREEHIFIGRDITRSEDFSQETAREIDLEIRRIIDDAKKRTEELLRANLDKLQLLGETLLQRETMNAAEVYELLDMEMPAPKTEILAEDNDAPVEAIGKELKELLDEQSPAAPAAGEEEDKPQ